MDNYHMAFTFVRLVAMYLVQTITHQSENFVLRYLNIHYSIKMPVMSGTFCHNGFSKYESQLALFIST